MSLDWTAPRNREAFAAWQRMHNTGDDKFPEGSPEDLEGDKQWVITESLIFRCMGVDLGGITEKNIDEFYFRNNYVSRIIGKPFRIDGEDADFTYEDLVKRIGLSTNVHTTTRAAFKKRWSAYLERQAESSARYAKSKYEKSMAEKVEA